MLPVMEGFASAGWLIARLLMVKLDGLRNYFPTNHFKKP